MSPVFLRPRRRLGLWDVMAGLRLHNEGTPQDP